jgi:antitoxin component YwqK of YwqJK toxin-antitoxin module
MDKYFNSNVLLQNTLLPYLCEAEPLKLINKLFNKLNYEKYLTYTQPHGIRKTYYSNNKNIKSIENYRNGELNGLYQKFYKSGKLYIKEYYKDDVEDGLYEKYYENGKLNQRCYCKDGYYDGLFESWNQDGELIQQKTYKDGLLIRFLL